MFLNREGRPLTPERLRVFFRRYRRKAKISEEFIVHSLRHSFATKLVEEGVPLVQVKELLGHSCIRSTMRYVHVANNMQRVKSPLDIYLEKEGVK
jgi:site-specific recombinase XerD